MQTVEPRRAEAAAAAHRLVPSRLRLVAGLPPEVALGRAAAHLMRHKAFAAAPFGHIVRSLVGQVNRGHYAFVADREATVGFLGWARAPRALAEAWLAGERPLADAEARAGDCALLNYVQADRPEVSRFLLASAPRLLPGVRTIYARRHYPDGRVRPVRLPIDGLTSEFQP